MVTAPLRALPAFALTAIVTFAAPLPDAPDVIWIQSAWLDAVHAHPATESTWMVVDPPEGDIATFPGASVNLHGAGSWAIAICASFTATMPRRADGVVFSETRNATEPSP